MKAATKLMSVQNAVVVALLLLSLVYCLSASPAYMFWKDFQADTGSKPQQARSLYDCVNSDMCERCAKFIRNEVIYTWCCNDIKDARKYCQTLLEYNLEK